MTPDCWETCDWSGNEQSGDDWGSCSDWTLAEEEPPNNTPDFSFSPPFAESTPRKNRIAKFQMASPLKSSSASFLSPVRKSPRAVLPRPKFDPSRTVTTEDGWQLSSVIDFQGCKQRCCVEVHGLSEYDVLTVHSSFSSKSPADRRSWLLEYFETNCPQNDQGEKDPKSMKYILCGRQVCQPLWQAVLSISTSTFYGLRKDFLDGKHADKSLRMRSLSSKSMEAEWHGWIVTSLELGINDQTRMEFIFHLASLKKAFTI